MILVCGTDFSAGARPAAAAAVALASRMHASELWLVHVVGPALGSIGTPKLREAAEERLHDEATRLLKEPIPVRCAALTEPEAGGARNVGDALLHFARSRGADLLVVASQGHGSSPLYRIGGTSERLAESAEIPVLVVRDAAPFEAWARESRPLRILLGVDWTRSCDAAIRWVKTIRRAGPCDVVVGHVYYSTGEDTRRYGLMRPYGIIERNPEAEPLLARDLAARVGDLGGEGEVVFRPQLGVGRLGDHLLALAETERSDLIVVGSHQRRGLARLGSVASVTLHYSHASVAVLPVSEHEILASEEVPCIRRVIVPTDLSPLSSYAVPFAYTLLGPEGGEVCLLHVLPGEAGAAEVEVVAQLRSLAPRRGVPANVTTRTEVVHDSNPARAIVTAAERFGADAICMGSHGRTGLVRAVVGSVTEAVMHESRRPILIVRPLPP